MGCGQKPAPVNTVSNVPQLYPTGLNEQGSIVGSIRVPDAYPAFVLENGQQRDLAVPSNYAWVYPQAINAGGQIVGFANHRATQSRHAVMWQNSVPTLLPDGEAQSSEATALNRAGDVAGFYIMSNADAQAVLWRNGSIKKLQSGGVHWRPTAINDSGTIVGCGLALNNRMHCYIWRQERLTDLGEGFHIACSNRGQLAGDYVADNHLHACVWNNGQRQDLPFLPGTRESRALAINDRMQIVGSAAPSETVPNANGSPYAILWQNGHVLDLNALVPHDNDTVLEEAVAINNASQIVCTAHQGKWGKTALLTPSGKSWQVHWF